MTTAPAPCRPCARRGPSWSGPMPERAFAFDRDVAVEPIDDTRWPGEVESRWNIGSAPNGGYLVSIALSALHHALPHPDPVAVSAHFPSRVSPGPVEVAVEPIRVGRGHSTAEARLEQDGEPRVLVTATFGDLGSVHGPTLIQAERPEIVAPEACIRAEGPVAPEFVR